MKAKERSLGTKRQWEKEKEDLKLVSPKKKSLRPSRKAKQPLDVKSRPVPSQGVPYKLANHTSQ